MPKPRKQPTPAPSAPTWHLTIELVPKPVWYSNLRKVMPRSQWDVLRRRVYAEYHHVCGICGASGRLECHERWEYDDVAHVQKLLGFFALCVWCHHVKHLGLADILVSEGKLDMERVIAHFMRVNQCSRDDFEDARREAFAIWTRRNHYQWRTDLGAYSAMIIAPRMGPSLHDGNSEGS